ncbi:phage holin [Bacillus aerolatus]|uniref:Phage holin n=1 Tax=Bacillus aerolatus TaxID=2653354 RepID=A0A6I1FLT8_9BACI|nr:phage holin [Bacillus aerolatus]KAB7707247.1 phage holin [Bacillus aerolatus]
METGTIVRTVILFVALINQGLAAFGYSILPFSDEEIDLFVSTVITVITAVVAWWKNNNITRKARRNEEYLKQKKMK